MNKIIYFYLLLTLMYFYLFYYHSLLSRHFHVVLHFTLFILLFIFAAHAWKFSLLVLVEVSACRSFPALEEEEAKHGLA